MTVETEFNSIVDTLKTLPVNYVWRGYGSAIFLEFGELTETFRMDGSKAGYAGEITLMIEWSWRVEDKTSVVIGSWSKDEFWLQHLERLKGQKPIQIELFGNLPEIAITFENELRVLSFTTTDGDPEWAIIDKRADDRPSFHVESGVLVQE